MLSLKNELYQVISAGLQRKSIDTCSKWTEQYRIMGPPFPGPWRFKYFPWTKEMHDSTSEINVGMKSSQMAFTETLLNISFYTMDIKQLNVLYLLPAKSPDASDFSARAFDPALQLSEHLNKLFNGVKNVGLKQAGIANLYIRGMRSKTGLKSVPASLICFDELEEMDQENIPLAEQRSSGQLEFQNWKVSTPRIEEEGIDLAYKTTDQSHFQFPCPSCNKWIELTFPECLEINAKDQYDRDGLAKCRYICPQCKNTLQHELKSEFLGKGKWIPSVSNRDGRGWNIGRLNSSAKAGRPDQIAIKYFLSLLDPYEEQEFWNSVLGLPHVVKGAQITDDDLNKVIKEYRSNCKIEQNTIVVMGIDVGTFFHYEISEYKVYQGATQDVNTNSRCKIIKQGKVQNPAELDVLMKNYPIEMCVMDANPERRIAQQFKDRFPGRVRLCFYGNAIRGKVINVNEEDETITVDRTNWLDISLGRIKNQKIILPMDTDVEVKQHLKAQVRVYVKDKDGNPIGKYISGTKADHYGHARNYNEIALPLAFSQLTSSNLGEVL